MTLETWIAAITAMTSHLPVEQARQHADAAMTVATPDMPVELILSMAFIESRFDQRALSRRECESDDPESCVRKTTLWTKATKPPKARPSWYCGPMQTGGYVSWAECQKRREDVAYGYATGVEHLQAWLDDKRCARRGDDRLRCALAGYNGGNAGVEAYKTSRYANWVLVTRDRIAENAKRVGDRPTRLAF